MRANLSSTDFWREFRRDWWGTLRRAYTASNDDNLGLIAAGTAFYAFSSIAPILAASVLSYGLIADAQTVQANIRTLFDLLPADAARLIGQQMDMVVSGSEGKKGLGLVIALAIAIYGGSRAATAMMTALNVAYEAKEKRNYLVWMLTAFAVVAGGVVLEAIHRYKYQRQLWFEAFLAGLLIRQAAPELGREHWDWRVPVPLHPTKEREREFNQAWRLARRLGAAAGIPVQPRLLQRARPTRTQTRLSRAERAENMRAAFRVAPDLDLGGSRIVLVDDVFTTGATTSACARALREAGAGEVCVWTVARGL